MGLQGLVTRSQQFYGMENASVSPVTVAPGGTIGVYTSTPVQMIASTQFDITAIRVRAVASTGNSGLRSDLVFDLMKGSAGSETPIIGPLIFGGHAANSTYVLPIYIPAGTRLSARTAAGVASRSGRTFSLDYWGSSADTPDSLPTRWVAYGVTVTSGSGAYGVAVTPGSSGAWGSWTAIANASTTYCHDLWLPMIGTRTATVLTAQTYRVQYAIASTSDAATMLTNGTGVWSPPAMTTTASEVFADCAATTVFNRTIDDIMYAPRVSSASVSARMLASGTPDSNAWGIGVLAAVK